MAEGIRRNGSPRIVADLLLQEVKAELKILDDIVIVGATLIMLDISPADDLPVLGSEKLSDRLPLLVGLFEIPSFEKPHFAVKK